MKNQNRLDVAIIGGGPAGMSAALISGRVGLSTLVVNAEEPRNNVTTASHGFLTRDGAHPTEFLEVAKSQLEKYKTVRYVQGRVREVRSVGEGFELSLQDGETATVERVVIATGYRDDLQRLNLPGIERVYGKSVYPCPFCDGFEHRAERMAVFGGEGVEHFVSMVRMWSEDLVVFTNGEKLNVDESARMTARGVRVYDSPVTALASEAGVLRTVELEDGQSVERDCGFLGGDFSEPATRFAERLGVEETTNGWGMKVYVADSAGKTNVPGVYVVGDAKSGFGGLLAAAREGAAALESIAHDIAATRWASLAGADG